jgi:hypothetical protein
VYREKRSSKFNVYVHVYSGNSKLKALRKLRKYWTPELYGRFMTNTYTQQKKPHFCLRELVKRIVVRLRRWELIATQMCEYEQIVSTCFLMLRNFNKKPLTSSAHLQRNSLLFASISYTYT